jgi:hypothetical protein
MILGGTVTQLVPIVVTSIETIRAMPRGAATQKGPQEKFAQLGNQRSFERSHFKPVPRLYCEPHQGSDSTER